MDGISFASIVEQDWYCKHWKVSRKMKWYRLVYQGEYIIAAENEKEAEELFNSECTELNESEGIEIRYIEELKGEEE